MRRDSRVTGRRHAIRVVDPLSIGALRSSRPRRGDAALRAGHSVHPVDPLRASSELGWMEDGASGRPSRLGSVSGCVVLAGAKASGRRALRGRAT